MQRQPEMLVQPRSFATTQPKRLEKERDAQQLHVCLNMSTCTTSPQTPCHIPRKQKRLQRCCASGKWTMASHTLSVRHSQSAMCPPSLNPFMIHRETDSELEHRLTSGRMYTRSCLGASHARRVLRSSNKNGIVNGRAFSWHSGRLILWNSPASTNR